MEFKDKLKELRKEKEISQQVLAAAVLTSRSTVAKWENGLCLPSEESLARLAAYFSVSERELLTGGHVEAVLVDKNKALYRLRVLCISLAVVLAVLLLSFLAFMHGCQGGQATPPILAEAYVLEVLGEYESVDYYMKESENGDGSYSLTVRLPRDTVFRFVHEGEAGRKAIPTGNISFAHVDYRLLEGSCYFLLEEEAQLVVTARMTDRGEMYITGSRYIGAAYGSVQLVFENRGREPIALQQIDETAIGGSRFFGWCAESLSFASGERFYVLADGERLAVRAPTADGTLVCDENGTVLAPAAIGSLRITLYTDEYPALLYW